MPVAAVQAEKQDGPLALGTRRMSRIGTVDEVRVEVGSGTTGSRLIGRELDWRVYGFVVEVMRSDMEAGMVVATEDRGQRCWAVGHLEYLV